MEKINSHNLTKLIFLNNSLDDGWTIQKIGKKYILTKKHHKKKEYFEDDFLDKFIEKNTIYLK